MSVRPQLRCAVYTRVSTDSGLDQEFNSLDNQREAAEAFVKSQAHEGWRLLREHYDDGGFSGGSIDRPALQRLLEQVRLRRVDIIVVYKVDRLTRSLADFAKLVELFDANSVSFVSVTQAFNTTTSMGRLTLNVLLSFAQFEREVTGERIRDKIAASKRRGLWVGGNVPLGYRVENKKLVVVEEEAEQVRLIFRRYLELGSLGRLLEHLREQNLVTKRLMRDGVLIRGGIPFARGSLAHLLHNRFYVGEITFKGAVHAAEHPPILDRALFDAVQEKLSAHRAGTLGKRGSSGALLIGKLFDDAGHRMTPTHANKGAMRYRYYVSAALMHGQTSNAGSVTRVSAPEIETIILKALRDGREQPTVDQELIDERLLRAVITPDRIRIEAIADDEGGRCDLSIPWTPTKDRSRREVIRPVGQVDVRPMRPETREIMVRAIAQGRFWLDETIRDRSLDLERIATREGCSRRQVAATISLAHLAPDIVEAALGGKLPHGISLRGLSDLPMLWSQQRAALGLSSR